LEPSENLV